MAGQKTDDRDRLLGTRLVTFRKSAKMTQRKVADSFGMSAAQLQKYEKGANRISAIHLSILSRLTGVPIAHFLEGIPPADTDADGFGEKPQDAFVSDSPWTGLAIAITRHVNQNFNEVDRRDFANFAEILRRELHDH